MLAFIGPVVFSLKRLQHRSQIVHFDWSTNMSFLCLRSAIQALQLKAEGYLVQEQSFGCLKDLFCQVRPSSTSKGALIKAAQPARPLIFAWQHQQRASSQKTAPKTSATFRQARSDILQVHPTTTRVAVEVLHGLWQKAFLKLHRARTSMAMDGCMDG